MHASFSNQACKILTSASSATLNIVGTYYRYAVVNAVVNWQFLVDIFWIVELL